MRATVAGIVTVLVILVFNIGVIYFILSHATKKTASNVSTIVTSPDQLGQIGSSEGPAGQNINLVVTPNAQFKGQVTIDKGLSLGDKLTAPSASLSQLQAGSSSLSQLNVNGTSTLTDASLRGSFNVTGTSSLQGPVTVAKLLTAAAINVTGNLSVGGALSTNEFSSRNLTAISTLTVGGHIVTAGSAPGWSRGSALRSNDSVNVAGNDISGTVVYGAATGQANQGNIVNVSFLTSYAVTPHIVLTAVNSDPSCAVALPYISSKSKSGFTVALAAPPNVLAGYNCQFDYEVMQ